MADSSFIRAQAVWKAMIQLIFRHSSNSELSIIIPDENANALVVGILNALQGTPHSPFIRQVLGIRQVPHDDATQPSRLRIVCETTPISRTAAVELEAALGNTPLTRGS